MKLETWEIKALITSKKNACIHLGSLDCIICDMPSHRQPTIHLLWPTRCHTISAGRINKGWFHVFFSGSCGLLVDACLLLHHVLHMCSFNITTLMMLVFICQILTILCQMMMLFWSYTTFKAYVTAVLMLPFLVKLALLVFIILMVVYFTDVLLLFIVVSCHL